MTTEHERQERRIRDFFVRVGILLGVLALLPGVMFFLRGSLGSRGRPLLASSSDFVRITGRPVYGVWDLDGDGTADCLKKLPFVRVLGKGYAAQPGHRRCRGRGVRPMPADLRGRLTELLQIKTTLGVSPASFLDLDGDDRADCIVHGATFFRAGDHACPEPFDGTRPMTEQMRDRATRAMRLERRIRAEVDL